MLTVMIAGLMFVDMYSRIYRRIQASESVALEKKTQ